MGSEDGVWERRGSEYRGREDAEEKREENFTSG